MESLFESCLPLQLPEPKVLGPRVIDVPGSPAVEPEPTTVLSPAAADLDGRSDAELVGDAALHEVPSRASPSMRTIRAHFIGALLKKGTGHVG